MEVIWAERSGVCETGFVGDENILQKMSIFLLLPQAPIRKLFTKEVVGREQILHVLKMEGM